MSLKNRNKTANVILLAITSAFILVSCQKEISGFIDSFGCKVQQWTNVDSVGVVKSRFAYTYDSVTTKPTQLIYKDSNGATTTVIPIFYKDTVYFASGSYAVLNGSSRITYLHEKNALAGLSANGDYYYEYDATGHLTKRTYDDGTASHVSNLIFTGDSLTKITTPSGTIADVFSLTYTYSTTQKVTDFNYFMLARNFPELQFYLPCFNIGMFTNYAIATANFAVVVPVSSLPSYSSVFSNYAFTSQGYIDSVAISTTVSGDSNVKRTGVTASYLCK